jgi:hypothetical protein
MYEKHLHIQQNVVLIYHFLLVVSSPIEDHYHDPNRRKQKIFSFKKEKDRFILELISLNFSMYQKVFPL